MGFVSGGSGFGKADNFGGGAGGGFEGLDIDSLWDESIFDGIQQDVDRIKDKMKESNAILGGEMSGHTFFKDRYYGFDDAVYAGCRIIEILAEKKAKEEKQNCCGGCCHHDADGDCCGGNCGENCHCKKDNE